MIIKIIIIIIFYLLNQQPASQLQEHDNYKETTRKRNKDKNKATTKTENQ
jgi:hypothetical protein